MNNKFSQDSWHLKLKRNPSLSSLIVYFKIGVKGYIEKIKILKISKQESQEF